MSRHIVWISGIALALLAPTVCAQPPGGQGRGGFGPFRFGGPGGMADSAVNLLRIPEVQQELALTDEQRKPVDELLQELQDRMIASFGSINFQELATLSDEERF